MSKMKVALMIKISGETAKKRLNMWEGREMTNSAFISPVWSTELLKKEKIYYATPSSSTSNICQHSVGESQSLAHSHKDPVIEHQWSIIGIPKDLSAEVGALVVVEGCCISHKGFSSMQSMLT